MSVKFLISKDITDSTLKDDDGKSLIGLTQQQEFLDESNEWYEEQSLELRASVDSIIVYDPNIDTEDLRNKTLVRMVRWFFRKTAFYALMKKGKIENDIYYNKYTIACTELDKLLPQFSYNRITGVTPATTKTSNSFATVTKRLGDSAGNTCRSDNFDCWDR